MRQGRILRKSFYDAMSLRLHDLNPGLVPSGQDEPTKALHIKASLAWYTASASTLLPLGAWRLSWISVSLFSQPNSDAHIDQWPRASAATRHLANTARTCTHVPKVPASADTTRFAMLGSVYFAQRTGLRH